MNQKDAAVLKACLCDGWSQRRIQDDILGIAAPERGGGYETMRILRKYGITGEYKSCLSGKRFDAQALAAAGNIQNYLRAK